VSTTALPHNTDAEKKVLGVYMLDAEVLLTSDLVAHDFYAPQHQTAFTAMRSLSESGEAVNPVTVVAEAKRQDGLGAQRLEVRYLEDLLADARQNFVAVAQNSSHEHLIRDAATRRALFRALSGAASSVLDESQDLTEVRDHVQNAVLRQGADADKSYLEGGSGAVRDAYAYLDRLDSAQGGLLGLSTGLKDLDDLTGGLQRGQLTVLSAATGGGKTTLALQFVLHALTKVRERVPVYYASLEMSRSECTSKMASAIAQVNLQDYRKRPNPRDRARLTRALDELQPRPFFCDDASAMSLAQIRSRALQIHHQTGGLGLIVVDHLGLMAGDGRRSDSRTVEVGRFANGLKALSKELDTPVLALAQINRAAQHRADKRPTLADLRESGDIENAADVVMFVYSDAYYDPNVNDPFASELIIRKNRFGEQHATVHLVAKLEHSRYLPRAVHV
jgi:replicative DNA helicase